MRVRLAYAFLALVVYCNTASSVLVCMEVCMELRME